jgi:hypothetical protein
VISLVFKKIQKIIFMSFKKYEKNLDVENDLSHKHEKHQSQILCIFGYKK